MTFRSTDYALLSQASYKDPEIETHAPTGTIYKKIELDGVSYRPIDHIDVHRTGFQATAYERMDTHEVVIAYRGTEFDREPVHDGLIDAGMVLSGVNAQAADADAFTQRVLAEARQRAETNHYSLHVTVTGHSLGGTLAEISASRFNLHGETFNAYGAAGLIEGLPVGGHQVIDHVRATDVVSAGSTHFGEVRIYAAPQDIERLTKAGYRDDSHLLSPRDPLKAIDLGAHGIDNFVPDSKTLDHSIIDPENAARYRAHHGMIERYRDDMRDLRTDVSLGWELPKAVIERDAAVAHAAARAVEHGAQRVAQAATQGVHTVEHAAAQGAHAVEHVAQAASHDVAQAFNAMRHPGMEFGNSAPASLVRLDHPSHPDHALYQQAREAVHRLDAQHGRTPDQRSDNLAAALVVAARHEGMHRIDQVLLSEDATRAFAVQGKLDSPLRQLAHVETLDALNTPLAQSSDVWKLAPQPVEPAAVQTPPQHASPSRLE